MNLKTPRKYLALGVGLRLTFGVPLGVMLENVGFGISIGMIIGAGIGSWLEAKTK